MYVDKLDDIVNKHINTYHNTIKMKPAYVQSNSYINSRKEISDKDPKFKIGDFVRISKHKNIFAKGYIPNCSEKVFVVTKVKTTISWTYITENNCEKQIKKSLGLKNNQKKM